MTQEEVRRLRRGDEIYVLDMQSAISSNLARKTFGTSTVCLETTNGARLSGLDISTACGRTGIFNGVEWKYIKVLFDGLEILVPTSLAFVCDTAEDWDPNDLLSFLGGERDDIRRGEGTTGGRSC